MHHDSVPPVMSMMTGAGEHFTSLHLYFRQVRRLLTTRVQHRGVLSAHLQPFDK